MNTVLSLLWGCVLPAATQLRHGMSLLSHFFLEWSALCKNRKKRRSNAKLTYCYTQPHTYFFPMFQLVSWHCKSQTAWVRWLPICCAFIAKFIILGLMFNKKEWQVVKSVQSWCNTLLTHLYCCKAQTWKEHKCFSPLRPWGSAFKHALWRWNCVTASHDSVELLCHSKIFFFPACEVCW